MKKQFLQFQFLLFACFTLLLHAAQDKKPVTKTAMANVIHDPARLATLLKFPKNLRSLILEYLSGSWQVVKSLNCYSWRPIKTASLSPDGNFVAICKDDIVEVWNMHSKKIVRCFTYIPQHKIYVSRSREFGSLTYEPKLLSAGFTPDSKQVVTTSNYRQTDIFDIISGLKTCSLYEQTEKDNTDTLDEETLTQIAIPHINRIIIDRNDEFTILAAPFINGAKPWYKSEGYVSRTVSYSNDAKYIALRESNEEEDDDDIDSPRMRKQPILKIVTLNNTKIAELDFANRGPFALSTDGVYLAVVRKKEKKSYVDLFKNIAVELDLAYAKSTSSDKNLLPISQKIISKDIQNIVVAYLNRWEFDTEIPVLSKLSAFNIAISPDNKYLATIDMASPLIVIDRETLQQQRYEIKGADYTEDLRFSANGKYIFWRGYDKDANRFMDDDDEHSKYFVFDTKTGACLLTTARARLAPDNMHFVRLTKERGIVEILGDQAEELAAEIQKAENLPN